MKHLNRNYTIDNHIKTIIRNLFNYKSKDFYKNNLNKF